MTRTLIVILASSFLLLIMMSAVKPSENIINLKDCYNTFVDRSSSFSKKDTEFNINFATKKITEINKEYTKVWNIINNHNGVIEANVDGTNIYQKSLLILLLEEKIVLNLNHSGYNFKFQCKLLDNKKIKMKY